MAGDKDRERGKGIRITEDEIKKHFFTSIEGDFMTIASRGTRQVLLRSRIIRRCDPLITNKYSMDLARRLLRYIKEAQQDIENTSMRR